MLIALLCESEMKLADETIEMILDKVSGVALNSHRFFVYEVLSFYCCTALLIMASLLNSFSETCQY